MNSEIHKWLQEDHEKWTVHSDNSNCFTCHSDGRAIYFYPSENKVKYWDSILVHHDVQEHKIPTTKEELIKIIRPVKALPVESEIRLDISKYAGTYSIDEAKKVLLNIASDIKAAKKQKSKKS